MRDKLIKKISITGQYYDSYLYKDVLVLINLDKTFDSLNWMDLVDKVNTDVNNNLAYECAFRNSKFLYNPHYKSFYQDNEFRNLILSKIERIPDINVIRDESLFQVCKINSKNKELRFLPNDIIVYKNNMYFSDSSGVYYKRISSIGGYRSSHSLSPTSYWVSDMSNVVSFGLQNGGYLYLATLENGLWVCDLKFNNYSFYDRFESKRKYQRRITKEHTSHIKNNYSSLLLGSYMSESYFLSSYYTKRKKRSKNPVRLSELFNSNSDSFYVSSQDKIYQITEKGVNLIKFTQSKVEKNAQFSEIINVIDCDMDLDNLISSSVELFGIVLEYRDRLVIILSNNTLYTIKTENKLVNWRTFPRSQNYTNQIHLIFEDRIDIISINHDFLVDQRYKKFGVRYTGSDFMRERIDE